MIAIYKNYDRMISNFGRFSNFVDFGKKSIFRSPNLEFSIRENPRFAKMAIFGSPICTFLGFFGTYKIPFFSNLQSCCEWRQWHFIANTLNFRLFSIILHLFERFFSKKPQKTVIFRNPINATGIWA